MTRRTEAVLIFAAVTVQGPLFAYLSRQPTAGFAGLSVAALVLAGTLLRHLAHSADRDRLAWGCAVATGSLAMLLGWWADAGFGPLVGSGACLCGCAGSPTGLGLLTSFRWMQANMAAACALTAWVHGSTSRRMTPQLGRFLVTFCGMTVGMATAGWLAGTVRPAGVPSALLRSYLAMVAGMALGHGIAGRLLALSRSWRFSAGGDWTTRPRPLTS